MIRSFLTTALFALSLIPSIAQKAVPAKYELRLLAFTRDLQTEDAFAQDPAAKEGAAPIAAPIKGFLNHQFITVPLSTRKIAFTSKPDHESLKRPGELIGEVTLPANLKSGLLVFLPGDPNGKSKSRIMVINDSKGAFPAGSFHITNLSPAPIRLMLEKKNFDFTPGKTILIQDPPVREGRMCGMRAWAHQGNQWKPIATSLWSHPGGSRSVKILFQDPVTSRIQLRSFDDVPPRAEKATVDANATP